MTDKKKWEIAVKSVRGNSHIRNNLPNQDAFLHSDININPHTVILAISDGHGSSNSFRSNTGSEIAVELAVEFLRDIGNITSIDDISTVKHWAEEKLPSKLVKKWREKIDEHYNQNPVTQEEKIKLSDERGEGALEKLTGNPYIIYGATLLSVLITEYFILYMQLGDGDILCVNDDGETFRPIPKDSRLIANETTSLCSKDAWKEFYIRFQTVVSQPPRLIIVSTDGYSNSYANDNDFAKIGTDYLEILRHEGTNYVDDNLEAWLNDVSKNGSGDDITAGLIFNNCP
ncbi:MAG: PP2C family serine/threonine-protein phosphatase [Ignavibacteria bacterium]